MHVIRCVEVEGVGRRAVVRLRIAQKKDSIVTVVGAQINILAKSDHLKLPINLVDCRGKHTQLLSNAVGPSAVDACALAFMRMLPHKS